MWMAFLGLRAVVRWLPLPVAQVLGRFLGTAAYGLLGRYRRLTLEHLRTALGPAAGADTCREITRGVFVNLGKTAMEWFVLDRASPARLRRWVEVHGLSHLQHALAKGKGVIAVSAHFGNWELLPAALAGLGFEGGVLARPLRYPEYDAFLKAMRARKGVATYDRGSVKDVARALRANQIVGVVPDQDVDSLEGVFVEFFDRPAYTPVGPAALSLMAGAPIVPCFVVRDGRRFRVLLEEPIAIERSGDRTQDLIALTQQWSRVVESYIRRYPDQWAWMHRRWKTQPTSAHSPQHTADSHGESTRSAGPRRTLEPVLSLILCAVCSLLCAQTGWAEAPAHGEQAQAPAEEGVAQQMDRFTMSGYTPEGTKRWELTGTGASVESEIVTIHRPDAIGYDVAQDSTQPPEGPSRTAYLQASVAQVEQSSRRIRMEHDVAIHTSDGLWLFSPLMYWLPDQSELTTDQPVRLETDHMLLYGYGATGQTQLKQAVILRDVELLLNSDDDSAPGQAGKKSHVRITCDGPLTFDYHRYIATFERNVHVNDGQTDLYSDTLVAYLHRTNRTITYAQADGRVRIVQGPHTADSRRAIYEP
ncbi:MAG: LPS export ABC transporter periplasmic protein LptC, partial [Candidatus Omnitrophica bacterium]|nr:LPS export ABC transporter periplasmic protein LptC [Candidatus Omnitrophota bacterium]